MLVVRIGLISDSHGFLDEAIFAYFANCDELWHAGDFGPVEVLDRLKTFKPLRGDLATSMVKIYALSYHSTFSGSAKGSAST